MTRREVVKLALDHKRPPYVPWSYWLTDGAIASLHRHLGCSDLAHVIENHFLSFGVGSSTDIGNNCHRDGFGIVRDFGIFHGLGVVTNTVLPEPTLAGFHPPDPIEPDSIPRQISERPDWFRVFSGGGSLFATACDLRGTATLLMDFYDHPEFVRGLFRSLADHNIAQIELALKYDIDAVHFGDDWGQQRGLQMGKPLWMEFIYPEYRRMFKVVKDAKKYATIHSCGDVDELFEELIGIGLDCFNPFQPEVMDVPALMTRYRGRLSFHGGLSTQHTLPFGSPEDVRRATRQLLELGREGGYVFSPAHGIPEDVPPENTMAFVEVLQSQPGWKRRAG